MSVLPVDRSSGAASRRGTIRMTVTGFFAARRARLAGWATLLALAGTLASAQQQPNQRITPNFKDADIVQIAEAVGAATGKNFILDPRVRAQVTMLSSTPMSPDAFYQAFLSILQVHSFVAMPAGNVVKIVPDASARTMPGDDLPNRVSGTSDEIVTQVIQVKNVNAAQLVPILRSLIPQNGHLAAYQPSNILIISDRAANVNRIQRIIQRIDQAGDSDVEILPLQNASAADIVRVITTLYQQQQAQEAGVNPMKLVADDRSNSVLVSGDPTQRLRIKTLVAHLDTPLSTGGETQVRYLRYADAEKIAPKLKEQITGQAQATPGAGGAPGAATSPAAVADKGTMVWAEQDTNALVITAAPKAMRQINAIIDKLDIRRMQVLVEAIIVEVGADKSSALGVNWAVFSNEDDTRIPLGGFIQPVGGSSIVDLAQLALNPDTATTNGISAPTGSTFGIGRIAPTGVNFAAMLRAIRSDANTNIISTPSAVTMDNQEAELKVAQEVPFVTGSFTNTGGTGGSVNPFQTVQREEVGTILKVTPQLNGSDTVILKLELESSSLSQSTQAVDLITNKRTISTNVMIEDGGIVVLGGLISDSATKGEQRVPFLGRIPIIGLAFKTRNSDSRKSNLMVFIRPKILRDGVQAAFETDSKYRYMQDQQKSFNKGELLPLLPNSTKPKLPPPPPLPPPGTGEVDPRVQQEKQRQLQDQNKRTDAENAPAQVPPPESALPTNPPAPVQPQGAPSPQATPAPQPEAAPPR
jgi:general secretion pathway protein D